MKKIAIFDLDGTLLNTIDDLAISTNYALEELNYPQKTVPEIRSFVGNGVAKLIERALPSNVSKDVVNKCLDIFKEHYKKNMFNQTNPYDGIVQLLKNLKSKDVKIAIVSNKFDLAVKELAQHFFADLYDIALGENEQNGIRKKPSPDLVFTALDYFNSDKSQVVFIGDSEVDIQTAENSGVECISVLWGFKTKEFLLNNGAKNFVQSPEEILEFFK